MLYGSGLASFGMSVLILFFLLIRHTIIAHRAVITMREVPLVMDRIITAAGILEYVSDTRC